MTVGSLEYGVEHLHAPLIVVMGHTRCGAVKAAIDTPAPTGSPAGPGVNVESILSLIRPGLSKGETHNDPWTAAIYGGVEQTVEDLFRISRIIPEMSKAGEIGVVGAVYEIESGKVTFSKMLKPGNGEHDNQGVRLVDWKTAPTVASTRRH